MLKSEDQEYKSRHLTTDHGDVNDSVTYDVSFGILTGVDGLVDQFELDDARKGGNASILMQSVTWGAARTSRSLRPTAW